MGKVKLLVTVDELESSRFNSYTILHLLETLQGIYVLIFKSRAAYILIILFIFSEFFNCKLL